MNSRNSGKPLVSVVMPTYNQGKYINEAIESVLAQTYGHLELIIIDDFSTDGTEKVVAQCQDDRVKYFRSDNHKIIASSRNQGITLARGEYIAFLDSDDIWLPEKLEKTLNVMEGSEDIALTYARFKTTQEMKVSSVVLPKPKRCESGQVFKSLYIWTFIACSGVVIRKKVLERVGFFNTAPEFLAFEDTDLWLRIAQKHTVACADKDPLFLYRVHPKGISRGFLNKIRRSWVLRKKYLSSAGKYLFCKAMFIAVLDIAKQALVSFGSRFYKGLVSFIVGLWRKVK